jgi:hypothetical protein
MVLVLDIEGLSSVHTWCPCILGKLPRHEEGARLCCCVAAWLHAAHAAGSGVISLALTS